MLMRVNNIQIAKACLSEWQQFRETYELCVSWEWRGHAVSVHSYMHGAKNSSGLLTLKNNSWLSFTSGICKRQSEPHRTEQISSSAVIRSGVPLFLSNISVTLFLSLQGCFQSLVTKHSLEMWKGLLLLNAGFVSGVFISSPISY